MLYLLFGSTKPTKSVTSDLKGKNMPESNIQKTPREILYSVWGDRVGILPISGGWGHTKELVTVINKNDPIVNKDNPFNGLEIENIFIKYRTYIEFIHNIPTPSEQLVGIEFINKVQSLISDNEGKKYDKIEVEIRALKFLDFEVFKKEWEDNISNKDFDKEDHMKRRDEKMIYEKRDFWFEISSFYGDPIIY